ncbi:MAG: protein kinase domain-containing protein, partial [Thermoanaerobaculia bacterium]
MKKVLESALDRPASERSDFVAEACAADDALRAEVEALLEAHVEAGEFLEHSPATPASLIGTTVGSYRLIEMLGAGGMGEVYVALDTRLGRRVAVKFLSSQFTSDPERVRRFRQEAQLASGLNHPNILTIHELGEHHGVQFIASELVEGETLRARLEHGPMELSEIVRVASQVASALRTAHAAGVVHRDIKPENVMLRPDGYVKVLDFGLAKLSETSAPLADDATLLRTATGVVMGTTQYMSPEQVRGQVVDARTDQWSLGVVLYEMLSGRRPFEGSTGSDVIAAILEKEHLLLQAPEELRRITARLLRKKREERYPTASDLCTDLASFQKQSEAGPASPRGKLRVAGAAAAVVIVAASILMLNRDRIFRGKVSPHAEIRSIAVLPFKNVSGDARNEYLSLGMAEELIDSLGRIPDLKVASRTSAFAIERTSSDIREVGTR